MLSRAGTTRLPDVLVSLIALLLVRKEAEEAKEEEDGPEENEEVTASVGAAAPEGT